MRGYEQITQDIKQELERILVLRGTNTKRKIVIVYDDLDRITDFTEILGILRLVDLINDIKSERIAQIISYDHSKLLDTTSQDREQKRGFYEKYIERIIGQKFEVDGVVVPIKELIEKITEDEEFKKMNVFAETVSINNMEPVEKIKREDLLNLCEYIKASHRHRVIFCNNMVGALVALESKEGIDLTKVVNIHVLILTQLLKALSLEQYQEAKKFFRESNPQFKEKTPLSFENEVRLVLNAQNNLNGIDTKEIYAHLKPRMPKLENDENILCIMGLLFDWFYMAHSCAAYLVNKGYPTYIQFVEYHFPEIGDQAKN